MSQDIIEPTALGGIEETLSSLLVRFGWDELERADASSDAPVLFLGHAVPACLVHQDLMRIRNCLDLLLDGIDNTGPVVNRPGELVPIPLPYREIRAGLCD